MTFVSFIAFCQGFESNHPAAKRLFKLRKRCGNNLNPPHKAVSFQA